MRKYKVNWRNTLLVTAMGGIICVLFGVYADSPILGLLAAGAVGVLTASCGITALEVVDDADS